MLLQFEGQDAHLTTAETVLRLESCDFFLVTTYLTVFLFAPEIPLQI